MAIQRLRTSGTFRLNTVALVSVAAVALAMNYASGAATTELPLSLCAPQSNNFSTTIGNPFFPLSAGQQWVMVGKEGSQNLGLQITVLEGTEKFYQGPNAISTVRVQEQEWQDDGGDGVVDTGEFVIETSINYFAQTDAGTVCYFGEDVDIFMEDGTISHEGAWRADQRGNAPGIFMPANPQVGTSFQQEVAPGVAQDRVTIASIGKTVKTPAGTFTDTIGVREFNPLDRSRGTKSYARNIGLIQDDMLLLLRF
jgi:hypothetical protein